LRVSPANCKLDKKILPADIREEAAERINETTDCRFVSSICLRSSD